MASPPRAPTSRPKKGAAPPVFSGDALKDENRAADPPVLTDAVEHEDDERRAGDSVADITDDSSLQRREIPSFSETREARIAEAAYWRAERRGFEPGHELDDWLEAERQVDAAGSREVPKTG